MEPLMIARLAMGLVLLFVDRFRRANCLWWVIDRPVWGLKSDSGTGQLSDVTV